MEEKNKICIFQKFIQNKGKSFNYFNYFLNRLNFILYDI